VRKTRKGNPEYSGAQSHGRDKIKITAVFSEKKRSRVAESKGNPAFYFPEVKMRRRRNKAVPIEKEFSNRELIRVNLSQNHGFLFIGFVSKFINNLRTHQGGEKK